MLETCVLMKILSMIKIKKLISMNFQIFACYGCRIFRCPIFNNTQDIKEDCIKHVQVCIRVSSIVKRGVSSQFYEIRELEGRVSEIQIREIIHIEVLRCLVKLQGLGYGQIDQ